MTDLTTQNGGPISPWCFGTMQFGGPADDAASKAMFDACRAAGINHFDTARVYTGGASERIIGELIKPMRDSIYLATKVGYQGGSSRHAVQSQFDQSRLALDCDTVDLLYLHRFDPDTPLKETFETLAELQQRGLIRHIGVSNFAAWQVMKAASIAAQLGTRIDVLQPMYNLVKRQAEVELFPMAQDQGITICPYSPLAGGLLTGKYLSGGTGRLSEDKRYKARYGQDWMTDTAAALAKLAHSLGQHPATLAAAWAAGHPARPAPILSARSLKQLHPSLDAITFDMPQNLYDQITALSWTPPPATDRLEEA